VVKGEVYYANLNPVVGSEQGGVRPVVILQNDTGNRCSPTTIVAPVTKRKKAYMPMHVVLYDKFLVKHSMLLLEQIRAIDKSRLTEKIGKLSKKSIKRINKAIRLNF